MLKGFGSAVAGQASRFWHGSKGVVTRSAKSVGRRAASVGKGVVKHKGKVGAGAAVAAAAGGAAYAFRRNRKK